MFIDVFIKLLQQHNELCAFTRCQTVSDSVHVAAKTDISTHYFCECLCLSPIPGKKNNEMIKMITNPTEFIILSFSFFGAACLM